MARFRNRTNQKSSDISLWSDELTGFDTAAGKMAAYAAGDGEPILFLHGIPTHSYLWRDVVRVVALGNRVIVPDLIGFGRSHANDEADLSPTGQADAIEHLLAELDVESYAVVGHDYGALVACELIRRHPQRVTSLVITNTSLRHEDWTGTSLLNPLSVLKVPFAGEAALKAARPAVLKKAFEIFVDETDQLDKALMQEFWRPFEHGFEDTLLRLAREPRMTESKFHDWKAALWDYQGPALVVWGANDPAFRPDRGHEIVRLLHSCRFELFMHSNHFVPIDRPVALGRLISAFVGGSLGVT